MALVGLPSPESPFASGDLVAPELHLRQVVRAGHHGEVTHGTGFPCAWYGQLPTRHHGSC